MTSPKQLPFLVGILSGHRQDPSYYGPFLDQRPIIADWTLKKE